MFTDAQDFIDAWAAGKVRSLDNFNPRRTDPGVWGYFTQFPQYQPQAWAEIEKALNRYKAVLQKEKRAWKSKGRGSWDERLEAVVEGAIAPFESAYYSASNDAYEAVSMLNAWWQHFRRTSDKRAPMNKWRRASAQRVAARMTPSPVRIAARWMRAGLVQAPPAMLEAIVEWVVATAAATSIVAVDAQIAEEEAYQRSDLKPKYDEIQRFINDLRASPSWKLYKEIENHYWHIGGAYSRKLKIKAFQKMTPEKRELLDRLLGKELDEMQIRLDNRKMHMADRIEWMRERQQEYRAFTKPGVKALSEGEEASRLFDIDTTGWRYGTEDYLARLNDALAEQTRNQIESLEELKSDPKYADIATVFDADIRKMQQQIASGDFPGWKTIRVTLVSKPVRTELASWSRMERTIRVVIPIIDERYGLHELETKLPNVVRHELQHFAQSWLAAIAGETVEHMMDGLRVPAGMPGKKYRTPEFSQHMSPGRTREDTPAAKALRTKLRQQGVDTKKVNWHDLDDIEFYTELADSIERFKRNYASAQKKDDRFNDDKVKRAAIRFWTGTRSRQDWYEFADYKNDRYGPLYLWNQTDKFFAALNRVPGAAAKKKKALAEFVKAVL